MQHLLDFTYFRGDLYLALEHERYSVRDYFEDEKTQGKDVQLMVNKTLRQIVINTRKTLKRLSKLGVYWAADKLDLHNIGLTFS